MISIFLSIRSLLKAITYLNVPDKNIIKTILINTNIVSVISFLLKEKDVVDIFNCEITTQCLPHN
jgi:hypothetical protein